MLTDSACALVMSCGKEIVKFSITFLGLELSPHLTLNSIGSEL